MAKQIVWKDLPKRYNLFTRRSATMISLDNGSIIMHYGANTKINFVQETVVDGVRFFRTESAMNQGLNWAVKASSFILPDDDVASLEPSKNPLSKSSFHPHSNARKNKNASKASGEPKSEVGIPEDKKKSIVTAFKRFFRRK